MGGQEGAPLRKGEGVEGYAGTVGIVSPKGFESGDTQEWERRGVGAQDGGDVDMGKECAVNDIIVREGGGYLVLNEGQPGGGLLVSDEVF